MYGKISLKLILLVLIICTSLFSEERQKLAQTGMQFLSVASDARAASLGRSVTTLNMRSSSLFFNPAGLSYQTNFLNFSISRNNWIAGIYHNALSLSIAPFDGQYGVVGLSFLLVDYGEIQGAIRADNEQGYLKTEILKPTSFSLGLGYAKRLTNKFSVGGQVKIVHQNLGQSVVSISDSAITKKSNKLTPVAFDFGTIFRTGFKSLKFGMFIRNFSPEVKYVSESFQLPLEFSFGISMNVLDLYDEKSWHKIIVSMDAVHFRSHPEQINLGIEYSFRRIVFLRFGYRSGNDENNVNFGLGVNYSKFAIHYGYTPFGVFSNVQRFTIEFSL